MDAALKAEIQEIIELVKTVPESLQLRTLELLLQDTLSRTEGKKPRQERIEHKEDEVKDTKAVVRRGTGTGLDVGKLPMRVKAFMKKHEVTDKQLDKLFHIEDGQYEPIWTVETTKFSKAQVQIALLQSLQRGLTSGEFSFDREEVKTTSKERGSYNEGNFKANFQNNSKYFSGLDKDGLVSLTDEGMRALAALVTELAGTGDGE